MQGNTLTSDLGYQLQTYTWSPKNKNGVALYLVHGYAEHSGRYNHVAKYFTDEGFTVFGIDHYGHGKSEGKKALVTNVENIISDLFKWVKSCKSMYSDLDRHYILGHSMGGLLTSFFVKNHQAEIDGFLLSAPLVMTPQLPPAFVIKIGEFIGRLMPNLALLPFNGSDISRDAAVLRAFENDPYTYKGKVKAGTGAELYKRGLEMMSFAGQITLQCWVGHSSTDRITDFGYSKRFFDELGSEDKTFQKYDGLYHELLNEPEKRIVMGHMLTWLKKREDLKPPAELPGAED